MDKLIILQELYDSGINFEIATFWDAGFDVSLGDEANGFKESTNVSTVREAVDWLEIKALQYYPDSDFARARRH